MSLQVQEGALDVAIVTSPGLTHWPSVGARALSALCAEWGLRVGVLGVDPLQVIGVLPSSNTGGLVFCEDPQQRIHRIQAKSIVRFASRSDYSQIGSVVGAFPGWLSPGVLPLRTAIRLLRETSASWHPLVVILGTGNAALRFGSELLEKHRCDVVCLESHGSWGNKGISGWEVEKRRFEMLGGQILEGKPTKIFQKAPLLWDLEVESEQGSLHFEVSRLIMAGPFAETSPIREYPAGSLLFEMDQTSYAQRLDDLEGWITEEDRARWLAYKLIRLLAKVPPKKRAELVNLQRRFRSRISRASAHIQEPKEFSYHGKLLKKDDLQIIKQFSGVPQKLYQVKTVASIECFENISCQACQLSCPEAAIQISWPKNIGRSLELREADCTACGNCLRVCPSSAITLIKETDESLSRLTFPWKFQTPVKKGEFIQLLNRRGEWLGQGRVVQVIPAESEETIPLIEVEVAAHLAWEVRGIRKKSTELDVQDEFYYHKKTEDRFLESRVEVFIEGERRFATEGNSVWLSLAEMGRMRSEDILACSDHSCGLCEINIDGNAMLSCQNNIRKGMNLKLLQQVRAKADEKAVCPCLGIHESEVVEGIRSAGLKSAEAVLEMIPMGCGQCHGRLCMGQFRRILEQEGVPAKDWIDWRFPMRDWRIAKA